MHSRPLSEQLSYCPNIYCTSVQLSSAVVSFCLEFPDLKNAITLSFNRKKRIG